MLNVCFLTNESIQAEFNGANYNYSLNFGDRTVQIFVCHQCSKSMSVISKYQQKIVKSLIAKGQWPDRTFIIGHECANKESVKHAQKITLLDALVNFSYPKTTTDKLNNLFLNLFNNHDEDGQYVTISCQSEFFYLKNFFNSPRECFFYFENLLKEGLIEKYTDSEFNYITAKFRITLKGLSRITQLQEAENPKSCFIAMAFDDKTILAREAIRRAVTKSGFDVTIIDEVHLKSNQTIPDAILAGIKQSKFCIADFTLQRAGVYFESGYALGLGKPVIYICSKDDFDNSHFDIKQLQHIIYADTDELENLLYDKIEAWIK